MPAAVRASIAMRLELARTGGPRGRRRVRTNLDHAYAMSAHEPSTCRQSRVDPDSESPVRAEARAQHCRKSGGRAKPSWPKHDAEPRDAVAAIADARSRMPGRVHRRHEPRRMSDNSGSWN